MARNLQKLKLHAKKILRILKKTYGEVDCALRHTNPFQLSVATILSAQCTDKRVNLVTPTLFGKFPTPEKMAAASLAEIEGLIRSTGFYKNKAKSLKGFSKMLLEKYGGKVPHTLEALTKLPGFGRKTANVVLGVAYGIPGFVVDTHVKRLTNRMGLTTQKDPTKIEFEIMEITPKAEWNSLGLLLIRHGREICDARKPRCGDCPLESLCPKIDVKTDIG